MRKHGWRTPEWKLIRALEPDFHFKPRGGALQPDRGSARRASTWPRKEPGVVALLEKRMEDWIARREKRDRRARTRCGPTCAPTAGPRGTARSSPRSRPTTPCTSNPMRVGRTVRTLVEKLRALGYA